MAADQERAERIRALKDSHPDITFRMMGEAAGVSERAAADWPRTGGIAPENTKKLAALFQEHGENIDWRWLHFGAETDTPTPFAGRDQVADIREEFREDVNEIKQQLEDLLKDRESLREEIGRQNDLLTRQSTLLEKIERLVGVLEGAKIVSEPGAAGREHPPAVGAEGPPPTVQRAAPDSSKTGNQDDQTRRAERQIP